MRTWDNATSFPESVGKATLPEGNITSSDTLFGAAAATRAGQGGWANDGQEKREKGEAKNEIHLEDEKWARGNDEVVILNMGIEWVSYIVNCSGVV